ncbi:MAG: hypothetical protein KJ624_08540 [Chloroflexi bacterium]|nr:hypothetical protein [Chloroflexota bacterium]
MSARPVLIGLMVMVLALGAIGAALATGMNFSNVGALSSAGAELPQVNTDRVGFISLPDGSGVGGVALSFDRDLAAGSTIWVAIDGQVQGWKVLDSFLSADGEAIVPLDEVLKVADIGDGTGVTVAVAER